MVRTVTIIQARTSSSRLPGKALLPVAGYPSAILAALRAANRGHETILATSDQATDDELARQARSHGLAVFRGPLDDVLGRYYFAASALPDDCAVIRLTADNVVPDGEFVGDLAQAFANADADYVNMDSVLTGLPYGVAGEAFSVAALRRAHREAVSAGDREHVGPWIKRNCQSAVCRPQRSDDSNLSYLRCTIDDEEDYSRILRLFEPVTDPLRVGWDALVHSLSRLPGEPRFGVPYRVISRCAHSQFTLGTAQLGMEYGAVNDHGQPSAEQAVGMVRRAIAHGVTTLDTARSYGAAEEVLGQALRGAWASRVEVITKLDLPDLPADAPSAQVRACVEDSVNRSCEALGLTRLAVVLLHGWQNRNAWQGEAWRHLLNLRQAGKVEKLGVSVYAPCEALEALDDPAIEQLQIPMNVLDWRWEAQGVDRAISSRPEVIVHARSALLQGALAHPATRWPVVEDFPAHECWQSLNKFRGEFGRESVTDLCLAYVRSLPWVTSVVVGCETTEQLDENLRLCLTPPLSPEQCERLRHEMPRAPEGFLNPSLWNVLHEHSAAR
jgi:spore coat polysaccharide biosynthesis protein SpsF (cytidylyltransferase family)/aryl-alcohol dehydrogenase-like predicted oxidoreductase